MYIILNLFTFTDISLLNKSIYLKNNKNIDNTPNYYSIYKK